ncbi:hypothetical protein [Aeromicrobium sp.]|uniref:hypothetical protein n=1 Tax=Aeromicrobium sp. TaxID=1871063 RepID=UPI0039E235BC
MKVTDHGFAFSVAFRADGTLEERDLKNPQNTVSGRWLIGGEQRDDGTVVEAGKGFLATNIPHYEMALFGEQHRQMVRGVEYEKGVWKPHCFVWLAPVGSAEAVDLRRRVGLPDA